MTQCLKCLKEINSSQIAHYGLHPECFQKWFNLSQLEDFISLQRRDSTSGDAVNFNKQNTSFFHGKFKKYSATLGKQSYILKMREEDAPELPEVEYLCNQIGKELGIPVAEFYFIDLYGDKTFVTKNFIKQDIPIDLQHLYHFRADEDHHCEGIINAIKNTTNRPIDIITFINTVLFDALIGNHDRHGRNLAFIKTATSTRLSPVYDNVSYLSLESGQMLRADFNPTGKISTKHSGEPSMSHYVTELKRLGFEEELNKFYKNVDLSRIAQLISDSFCSDLMKQAINQLIEKRFEELENAR